MQNIPRNCTAVVGPGLHCSGHRARSPQGAWPCVQPAWWPGASCWALGTGSADSMLVSEAPPGFGETHPGALTASLPSPPFSGRCPRPLQVAFSPRRPPAAPSARAFLSLPGSAPLSLHPGPTACGPPAGLLPSGCRTGRALPAHRVGQGGPQGRSRACPPALPGRSEARRRRLTGTSGLSCGTCRPGHPLFLG